MQGMLDILEKEVRSRIFNATRGTVRTFEIGKIKIRRPAVGQFDTDYLFIPGNKEKSKGD